MAPSTHVAHSASSPALAARLLLVDDEARVLRSLEHLFADRYEVVSTTDPRQALLWIEQQRFDVVMCDQRMPVLSGVQLLREIRQRAPHVVRLLLTGYADLPAVIGSINEGEIWRYIHKPWVPAALLDTVAHAVEHARQLAWLRGEPTDPVQVAAPTPVLVYDEDPLVVERVAQSAGPGYAVRAVHSLDDARAALAEAAAPLLVTETQMGGVQTLPLLRALKLAYPELILIVLARQQDAGLLIRLVNECQIFRFLGKPISAPRLTEALADASALRRRLLTARGTHSESEGPSPPAEPLGQRIVDYFRRRRA